ncbi:alpha/beta hydrolase [Henriciella mobilis]|uniref:alpha/beta fold hydrolase n=1 Tax=Henriciella mobilis TaxID=2305467 RepID=UPI000E672A73|nr:alpha/beta hydrolase [Henriciella mobilis]RIJ17813.1 alpha/beta hydrolase [Henriciella mobilis]RIJ25374.1 alpha/beta hydrolase [Henriciella mobilis]
MKLFGALVFVLLASSVTAACVHSAIYTSRAENRWPAAGQHVDLDDGAVHVIRSGEAGPVVLMIHGASANAREFTFTLAPRLDEGHRVLMADRPGHGYSARPDNSNELGVQAAQMAGVLEALAPGEKAVIVGHSFGGAVALRLALDYPGLVEGLVLLAPVTHDWGSGGVAWYNQYAGPPLVGPAFAQLAPIAGPAQVKNGIDDVFDPGDAPDGYYEDAGLGLLFRPSEFRANARDVNALKAELAAQQDRYGEISVPVILFSGAKDTVINPTLHAGKIKHQIADFTLVPLADGGHMPHHSHGEAVAEAIRSLARAGDQSSS